MGWVEKEKKAYVRSKNYAFELFETLHTHENLFLKFTKKLHPIRRCHMPPAPA
jgi:hypothetical protein